MQILDLDLRFNVVFSSSVFFDLHRVPDRAVWIWILMAQSGSLQDRLADVKKYFGLLRACVCSLTLSCSSSSKATDTSACKKLG